jgi:hypothetical protein
MGVIRPLSEHNLLVKEKTPTDQLRIIGGNAICPILRLAEVTGEWMFIIDKSCRALTSGLAVNPDRLMTTAWRRPKGESYLGLHVPQHEGVRRTVGPAWHRPAEPNGRRTLPL